MRSILYVAMATLCCSAYAQADSVQLKFAATITQDDLRRHLTILASDEYEGRETGMKGQKMAAQYIREQFIAYGIPPVPEAASKGLLNGYEQPFPLELARPGGLSLVVDGSPIGFMQEFFYLSERLTADFTSPSIQYVGYGRKEALQNDYAGIDVRGGAVLILEDGMGEDGEPPADFFQRLTRKTKAAEEAGAAVLLVATPYTKALMTRYAHYITTPRMKLVDAKTPSAPRSGVQTVIIDKTTAEQILAKGKLNWKKATRKHAKARRSIPCSFLARNTPTRERLQGENVLGYIEGTDKKDELVVITAHYDHIGKDGEEVFNGADDDGSGTVAVLEMAEAFARAKAAGQGPRRSVLFMPVSGEEKGLLGSEWYSDHPVFPLEQTVADLNIDMIGRTDSAHASSVPYVYIIGSDRLSTELHELNERANSTYTKLLLDNTFNSEDDPNRFYYRSDHYNFAKHGIPVIFYFNGVHEDYHQAGDETEKIRFDLLEQRTKLVFHTAWAIAEREQRPLVDKPLKKE